MKRLFLILPLALALASASPCPAQNPNGLAAEGINPEKDSLAILRVRHQLDSIRMTEKRPTIALVLSGGGAKGAAYIGILRYMEEMGIPIDLICGTSMGGIVGGLITVGYNADEMEEIFKTVDWTYMLGNKLENKYLPVRTKDFRSKYILNVPFHYDEAVAARRARMNEENPEEHNSSNRKMLASLPTGYVNGFNIDNMLSSLTVGFHDDMKFSDLPIPYFCVSSDLVTCKANYSSDGNLRKAIRATMAIPGVFAPVRTDGMILVDGGTRNNFPVDIAKAVGADIIIGAEVGDRDTEYSKINSIGDILYRLIAMLGDDARAASVSKPDLYIVPDLGGYGMLSFTPTAVNMLMESGYKAAKADSAGFAAIKAQLPPDLKLPQRKKAVNINKTKVNVSSVRLRGISLEEGKIVRRILNLDPGTKMGASEIEAALSRLQATGAFESVGYSLESDGLEGYILSVDCMPKQLHRFAFGLRFDTEEYLSAVVNMGLFSQRLCGSSLDFTLKVGNSQQFDVLYTYRYPKFPSFNAEASIFHRRGDVITGLRDIKYNVAYWGHREQVYMSTSYSTFYDVKLGIKNEFHGTRPDWFLVPVANDATTNLDLPDQGNLKSDHLAAFLNGRIDTYDTHIFPAKGIKAELGTQYYFYRLGMPGHYPGVTVNLDFTPVIPVTKWMAIIPDLHMRSYFHDTSEQGYAPSIALYNFVGGDMSGRYIEQQIRFVGFTNANYVFDHVGVLNLDLRFNPLKNFYLSLVGGYMRDSQTFAGLFESFQPTCWAVGAQAGYKTFAGPLKFRLNWCSMTRTVEYYLSLGFDF